MDKVTTSTLVSEIQRLQRIQSRNRPSTAVWELASAELAPLFSEMARRQKLNGGELDWTRWAQS